MARFGNYPTKGFKTNQKFLAQETSGQTVRVSGLDIINAINQGQPWQELLQDLDQRIEYFRTTDLAVQADLDVGRVIYTTGTSAENDGGQSMFVVVTSGTSGSIPMDNGNALLNLELTSFVVASTDSIESGIPGNSGIFDGQQLSIKGYYDDTDQGGGIFYWDSTRPKSEHNGGTVLSPTVPFNTIADYLDGVGETDPSGNGCWIRLRQGKVLFAPINFGARNGNDSTASIQKSIDEALVYAVSESSYLLPGDSFLFTGLDLSSSSHKKLVGISDGREFARPQLITTGSPTVVNQFGRSCAILLNDSTVSTRRGIQLGGFALLEGDESSESLGKRYYGVYGVGIPWHEIRYLLTSGFDVGTLLTFHWDSLLDDVSHREHRITGFATYNEDDPAGLSNVNGYDVGSLHASSTKSPAQNFDFRSANSIKIGNLVTEGTQLAHIAVGARTRSVHIDNIHKEGVGDFLTVDVDEGSPTFPFGAISIDGGGIFDNGGVGARFVKRVGAAANVGIAVLKLGAVYMSKAASIESDYFDMSSVGVLDTQALFEYEADIAIQLLTWKNVGSLINKSYRKGLFGHNGLLTTARNKGLYTGSVGQELSYDRIAGSDITSGQPIMDIIRGVEVEYKIELNLEYNAATFEGRRFWAQFVVLQAIDDTLTTVLLASNDLYALDCTFSIDVINDQLVATSPHGFGQYYFSITATENRPG